jgi:hypothetical protein
MWYLHFIAMAYNSYNFYYPICTIKIQVIPVSYNMYTFKINLNMFAASALVQTM